MYPKLLFWQLCLLASFSGILSQRYFWPGLMALVSVFILGKLREKSWSTCLFFILFFALGFSHAFFGEKKPASEPFWLQEAFGGDSSYSRPETLLVQAKIEDVELQRNGNFRLRLKDVVPKELAHDKRALYKGIMSASLRGIDKMPIKGQMVEGHFRFAKVRGFANPGGFKMEDYWKDRGVFVRAWNAMGKKYPDLKIYGEGDYLAKKRFNLWFYFIGNLPHASQVISIIDAGNPHKMHPELQGSSSSFLPALIFGDRSFLSKEQQDLVAKSTLAHSLALSGLHLGYATALAALLAWGISRVFPRVLLYISRPKLMMLLALPAAGAYLWIGGAPLSLIRAAIMLAFFTLLLYLKKPKVLLDGLMMAVGLILLLNPQAIFDLSLQLSALSVAVIALILPFIQKISATLFPYPETIKTRGRDMLGERARDRGRGALAILMISFSIQVFISPLILNAFGTIGLCFPLNLLWLPVLGAFVMPPAFLALVSTALGWDFLAEFLLSLAVLPCQGLIFLLEFMDRANVLLAPAFMRPHWLFTVGYWIFLLSLPLLILRVFNKDLRRGSWGFVSASTLIGLLVMGGVLYKHYFDYQNEAVALSLIDVGQGQSVLIKWPGGRALIDGGGFAFSDFDVGQGVVSPVLTRERPAKMDWFIVSHPDFDHLGGMIWPMEKFKTHMGFAHNADKAEGVLKESLTRVFRTKKKLASIEWARGDSIELYKDLYFEVLWPDKNLSSSSVNNNSLILRLVWKNEPLALICGDAGKPILKKLLELNPDLLKAQVLVLPHHGSASGYLLDFYDAVNPSLALASCGYKNIWSFPALKVREALDQRKIPLYTTADEGQVELSWASPESFALSFGRGKNKP